MSSRVFSLVWCGIGCFATVAITVLGGVILTNKNNSRAESYEGDTLLIIYVKGRSNDDYMSNNMNMIKELSGLSLYEINYVWIHLYTYGSPPFIGSITLDDSYVLEIGLTAPYYIFNGRYRGITISETRSNNSRICEFTINAPAPSAISGALPAPNYQNGVKGYISASQTFFPCDYVIESTLTIRQVSTPNQITAHISLEE
jgi:hypothetical protein